MVLIGQNGQDATGFLPTDKITFHKETGGLTKVHYSLEAKAGGAAIGGSIEDFEASRQLKLRPLFDIPGSETNDQDIAVSRVVVNLWANGSIHYNIEKTFNPPIAILNEEWIVLNLTEQDLDNSQQYGSQTKETDTEMQ